MISVVAPLITAGGAFLGAMIAALLGPWLLQRSKREQERRDLIRELIPQLVRNAYALVHDDKEVVTQAKIEHTALHSALQLHLRSGEWQIERMAWAMSTGVEAGEWNQGALLGAFPTAVGFWLRKEKSSAGAAEYFMTETGSVISRLPGAPPRGGSADHLHP